MSNAPLSYNTLQTLKKSFTRKNKTKKENIFKYLCSVLHTPQTSPDVTPIFLYI